MNVSWPLHGYPISEQFFYFAEAYLEASSIMCDRIDEEDKVLSYPKSCVILFLAFHAVELFLKAAILYRAPDDKLHHNIDEIKQRYATLFNDKEFNWNLPFRSDYSGLEPDQIESAKKNIEPRDQVYRYPVNSKRKEWYGVYGFEANSFKSTLNCLKNDFIKLKKPYLRLTTGCTRTRMRHASDPAALSKTTLCCP